MIDYAFELQHFVGELSSKEAKNELVEETWNAATMRLRFDPLKFKRWKTDLSVFTEEKTTVSVVPEAIPQAGDIDTPTVDNGTDFVSLDDGVVIQFKHKNKDGRLISLREDTPFYAYIICDLTEEIQTFAVNSSLTSTPDLQGFFGFNPGLKTYIEVLSFNKLVRDAKQRNNILFKKLGI
jgi:hypothetical protein